MQPISPAQCELFYPLTLSLDEHNVVVGCSGRLADLLGGGIEGRGLFTLFTFVRPKLTAIAGVVDLARYTRRLFLIVTNDQRFAFRGQVIVGELDGKPVFILTLTPWLTWLKDNRPDYSPNYGDYSLQDSQLDLEIYLNSQQAMMSDLRELSQSLRATNAQLTQAMQVRTKFLSYVSHELRTPLTGIISALPLFESQALDQEGRGLLDVMKSSSQSLLEIINQVLDFNEATEGSDAVHLESFDLQELLTECVNICSLVATKKQLQLFNTLDAPLARARFESDRSKLKKILINLLGNAVKYTQAGRVNLDVRLLDDSQEQCRLAISVHDDGVGVLPEDVPRLFDPYWKKVKTIDPNVPSSGLGLSITKRLVDVLGGSLGYRRSSVLVGSEFWVELALKKAPRLVEPPPEAPKTLVEILAGAKLAGAVLLVDDNDVNLMIGKLTLERAGMQVTTATSAQAAIALCNEHRFAVILMDILMPDMSGLDCSRVLRNEPNLNNDTPIIAWSAHCSQDDMRQFRSYGINDWLIKPPKPAVLIALMEKWQAVRVDSAAMLDDLRVGT